MTDAELDAAIAECEKPPFMLPLSTMAGCDWNVLDASGSRVALCGGDSNRDWECFGPPIAKAIVVAANDRLALLHELKELRARVTELERLNLEAQHRIADLCVIVGNINQCRFHEADSIEILCDNPEAESAETQAAVEACGGYTGYEPQRFYGLNWEEALARAARAAQRHYSDGEDKH